MKTFSYILIFFVCSPGARAGCGYVQRVNSGGPAYVDAGSNAWAADQAYSPGGFGYVNAGGSWNNGATIAGTPDTPLYQDFNQGGNLGYRFTVPDGQYQVTLKFAELWFSAPGGRVFNIDIQGFRVLSGLDVVASSGAINTAHDRVFSVAVYGGILAVDFSTVIDQAALNAIEVIQTSCPTVTPTPCGLTSEVLTNGTTEKINYMTPISGAEPGGWQNPAFADGAWADSVIWPSQTGARIDGTILWSAHDPGGPSNADDKLLIRRTFSLPAGATGISATITYAVDDSVQSWINGAPIQADLPSYISVPGTIRSFLLPPGSLVPGANVLAMKVLSPIVSYMGYSFKLEISYGVSCGSPTPTPSPSASPTRTPTPSPSQTPTPSMPLVKSASSSVVAFGSTVTFCIQWTNNAGSTQTLQIWDTLHPVLTYVGCDNGCSASPPLVNWSLTARPPGSTGSVCLWARVSGYP